MILIGRDGEGKIEKAAGCRNQNRSYIEPFLDFSGAGIFWS